MLVYGLCRSPPWEASFQSVEDLNQDTLPPAAGHMECGRLLSSPWRAPAAHKGTVMFYERVRFRKRSRPRRVLLFRRIFIYLLVVRQSDISTSGCTMIRRSGSVQYYYSRPEYSLSDVQIIMHTNSRGRLH